MSVMVLEMTGIGQGGITVETSLLAEGRRKGLFSGWLRPRNSLRTTLPPTHSTSWTAQAPLLRPGASGDELPPLFSESPRSQLPPVRGSPYSWSPG